MFRIGGYPLTRFPTSANPWSTAPVQTRPSYTYFTPAQVPAAEELNYIFASMSDAAATGVTVPGASWLPDILPASIVGFPSSSFVAAFYDPIDNEWLVALSGPTTTPTTHEILAGSGQGDPFSNVSSGTISLAGVITSVIFDGTTYFATGIRASDGACLIFACVPGGAWATPVTNTSCRFVDSQLILFNGLVLAVMVSNGSGNHAVYRNAIGSNSWPADSIFGGSSPEVASAVFIAAGNGMLSIFLQDGAGGSHFYTTPDGSGITARLYSSTSVMLHGPAEYAQGLCYSPADAAFVLLTDGADAKGHTYVSPDGITWSEQGTGMASVPEPAGLACTGAGCLVALADYSNVTYPIYSVDCGASWHWSTVVQGAPGFTPLVQPKVVASPTGVFATNGAHGRFSMKAGMGAAIT